MVAKCSIYTDWFNNNYNHDKIILIGLTIIIIMIKLY